METTQTPEVVTVTALGETPDPATVVVTQVNVVVSEQQVSE